MKHSELRLRNFVLGYNKEVERIDTISVHSEPAGSWPSVSFKGKHYYNYVTDLTPIPITEEWLRSFGFSIKEKWKSGMGENFYKEDKKVKVSLSRRHGIQVSLSENPTSEYMIEYIHELQNIYKELTGKELEYVE